MNIQKIKQLRIELNITQKQLATELDTTRSTIAKWETGKAMPRADKIPKLAQLFGCSTDELLQQAEKTESPPMRS